MRIRNNTMALNTHRMYTGNNSAIAKSAEKLSSGYRVNRAGDDAAGLAISEKMRAQVRGLSMASKNSSDAISMVQTAEGALQEVHSMLQRMNELAVQAASDTNVTIDRDALQLEFQNLQQEIDQISQTTKFNDTVLLDGSLGSGAAQGGNATYTPNITTPIAAATPTTAANNVGAITATLDGDQIANALAGAIQNDDGIGEYTFSFEVDAQDANKVNLVATNTTDANKTVVLGSADFTGDTSPATGAGALTKDIVTADGTVLGNLSVAEDAAGGANAGTIATQAATMTVNGQVEIAAAGAAAPAAAAAPADLTGTLADIDGTGAGNDLNFTISAPAGKSVTINTVAGGGGTAATATFDADGNLTIDIAADNGGTIDDTLINDAIQAAANAPADVAEYTVTLDAPVTVGADTVAVAGTAIQVPADADNNATAGNAAVIQVGAEEGHTLNISIEAITTAGLGLAEGTVKINGATAADARENASKAITATRAAINQVSTQRAQLGAMQNRLEYKINNLDTTTENLQAAESRIRDTDMAKEMSEFTKNNILSQAATAMLAQANAAPQNVLQLLG